MIRQMRFSNRRDDHDGRGLVLGLLVFWLGGAILRPPQPKGKPMLRFFDQLLAGSPAPEIDADEKLRLAATALLFRALYVDGHADTREEDSIRRIVGSEFGLGADEVGTLMDDARKAALTEAA